MKTNIEKEIDKLTKKEKANNDELIWFYENSPEHHRITLLESNRLAIKKALELKKQIQNLTK